jgi:hypothetical protein
MCVSGTTTCAEIGASGTFELKGDFTGNITLQFLDSQGSNITLTISNVQSGETIVVTVELNGTTGILNIESRDGPSG